MLFFLVIAVPALVAHARPSVLLPQGKYIGGSLRASSSIRNSQEMFLGIPYASPPIGSLRFRPPQPLTSDNRTHDATKYGPSCPQYGPFAVGVDMGEDCLSLNIVRPELQDEALKNRVKLPVLVWLYGGGFAAGSTSDPRYNLSYIVSTSVSFSHPIIAVSINYRTSAFGFLASSQIVSSGNSNLGLRDQRFALEWLQKNIDAFGGDPTKITVFGESAGAYSIGAQLLAYGGERGVPFRGAIMQSGTALTGYHDISFFQPLYDKLVSSANCTSAADTLECLRSVPFDELYPLTVDVGFNPVIDGDFLRGLPSREIGAGRWAKVPLLLGANSDEGSAVFFGPKGINTTADLENWLINTTSLAVTHKTASGLLPLYSSNPLFGVPYGTGTFTPQPKSLFGAQYKRAASLAGDMFIIAGRRFTAAHNAARGLPTFSYRFDTVPWELPQFITDVPNSVSHYSEIPFVFSNPQNLNASANWIGPLDSYHRLANLMTRAWISFAVFLDPNHHGVDLAPLWPDYSGRDGPTNLVFAPDRTYVEVDDFREQGIAAINDASAEFLR